MKTLAALAGALGLIVAALVVRNAIAGGDGHGDDASDASAGSTVVCPPELEAACRALGDAVSVRIEPATATSSRLGSAASARDAEADVWLVPAAWAALVSDQRQRAGLGALLGEPTETIARSPVTLVVWDDRAAALEDGGCAAGVAWRCLGDVAERPWGGQVGGEGLPGRVEVGLTDPGSALGLVVLGGAATGYFGDADYASNDFDGGFTAWLGALAANARGQVPADVVNEMLTRGPGQFSAVGALEVDALRAAGRDDVRVIYPAPVATAELVAIPIGEAADAARAVAGDADLRAALADSGWRVDGEDLAPGVDERVDLPDGDGLPSGGVLAALAARWNDVTG